MGVVEEGTDNSDNHGPGAERPGVGRLRSENLAGGAAGQPEASGIARG